MLSTKNTGTRSPNINISGTAYSQMEANFSLFWGLSIMLYEATLISDQTPFDLGTMTAQQQAGFSVFNGKGACNKCQRALSHDASVSEALANGLIDEGQTKTGHQRQRLPQPRREPHCA